MTPQSSTEPYGAARTAIIAYPVAYGFGGLWQILRWALGFGAPTRTAVLMLFVVTWLLAAVFGSLRQPVPPQLGRLRRLVGHVLVAGGGPPAACILAVFAAPHGFGTVPWLGPPLLCLALGTLFGLLLLRPGMRPPSA